MGAFSYADDISLLAPTVSAVNRLLGVADAFAKEYDVLFNPDKSKMITFDQSTNQRDIDVLFRGALIESVPHDVHLGNIIGANSLDRSVSRCVDDFTRRANVLLAQFGHASGDVKYQLLKTLCMCLYGCQLWDFSSPIVSRIHTAWRKLVRRVYGLPPRTHCALLHHICQDLPIDAQLHMRFIKFVSSLVDSANSVVKLCVRLTFDGSRSATSHSLNFICHQYGLAKLSCSWSHSSLRRVVSRVCLESGTHQDCVHGSLVRDLLYLRAHPHAGILSPQETSHMLTALCCD